MSEGLSVSDGAALLDAANTAADTSAPTEAPSPIPNDTAPVADNSGGGHPAWNEYLADIPEGFHSVVKPAFEKWDANVQKKLEAVQSGYAPYKAFADAKVDPAELDQSYQLYRLLQQDPRQVFDALAQNFGFGVEDQGQPDGDDDEFDLSGQSEQDITQNPAFRQLQQQQEALVANLQAAQQAETSRKAESWLDTKIGEASSAVKQATGMEPDKAAMNYILTQATAIGQATGNHDAAFEQAVKQYTEFVNSVRSQPRANANAPLVMPTGGGTPSTTVKPEELDGKSRRQLGVDMFRALNREG